MVRCARKKSSSGIYHIMLRGINRQDIFFDEEDYLRMLETMKRAKESSGCAIYGYCLMGNHIHLLLNNILLYKKQKSTVEITTLI